MAAGIVAALALPASAGATWRHHGTVLQENEQIGLTGQLKVQGALGGIECQITAKTTLQPGATGLVETFAAHPTNETTNCKGLGGLSFCQVHDLTALELPWTVHASEAVVTVTNGAITSQTTGGFCAVKHILLSGGAMTVTPNQPNTISSGQLSGGLTAQFETNGGTKDPESVSVSGTLNVESPNASTYSIGTPIYYLEGETEEPIGEEAEALEADTQGAAPTGWTLTMSNGGVLGPCGFSGKGKVWNVPGAGGHTEDSKMKFTTPCSTSMADCQVTAGSVANEPWEGTLFYKNDVPTESIGTQAKPIKFSYTLDGKGCGALKNVTVTATAQDSVFATHIGKGCFKFDKAGSFTLSLGGGVTGTLDAGYCRGSGGKPVPAK